jgi:lysine 6-dehydrogenase
MAKKIIVLGCGLVGKSIAVDLATTFDTTAADLKADAFDSLKKSGISTINADLSDPQQIRDLVSGFDLVIGALPGHLGYRTIESVIMSGKNIIDISFMPENYLKLNELARSKGVTAIVDCGVAPGMSNVILGFHYKRMKIDTFRCYVGGLPQVREWPYQYKAVFSPSDVIEEYTRPARFLENSQLITKEALSDIEIMDYGRAGKLEAWNSDGLRSLLETMPVPNMIEKTLRFPGTTEYIKVLRETGFFSHKEIEVGGKTIRPVDLTAKLLFPIWKLKPGEGDFTVMKIIIQGIENGRTCEYIYDLYDEYDKVSGALSMARTTGYTCTAAANLILTEGFTSPGICPPEYIGTEEKNFRFIMDYLRKRNVVYNLKFNDRPVLNF